MKINKLLFFLLAVFSLNSCVEYVDNGTIPTGPEVPEELKFVAVHSNPNEAKYIGDKFEFTAALNGVDVTKSTKFKVNGTTMPSNTYTPVKTGSHTVIATMDDYTSTFKFIVQEKEEEPEPEPTGNRIEYDGDWKPVTNTFWAITYNAQQSPQLYNYKDQGTDVLCTRWLLISTDVSDPSKILDTANNTHYMIVYVPVDVSVTPNLLVLPHNAQKLYMGGGYVAFNGNANEYEVTSCAYSFVSGTAPSGGKGTANYTADTTLDNDPSMAKLFWNGDYSYLSVAAPAPKGSNVNNLKLDKGQIMNLNFKILDKNQIENLKIVK